MKIEKVSRLLSINKTSMDAKVWVPCAHGIWRLARVKSWTESHVIVYHKGKDGNHDKYSYKQGQNSTILEEDSGGEERDIELELVSDEFAVEKEVHDIEGGDDNCYELPKSSIHPYDPSHEDTNILDVSKLSSLNEGALMYVMQNRLQDDCIYTLCGDVLISVNPFKSINRLYDIFLFSSFLKSDNIRKAFNHDKKLQPLASHMNILGLQCSKETMSSHISKLQNKKGVPHIYTIAQRAKDYLIRPVDLYGKQVSINQSIIISGESGAGKTEASKHIMKYLCFSTVHHSEDKSLISGAGELNSISLHQSIRKRSIRRTNQRQSSIVEEQNDIGGRTMMTMPTLMFTSWEECTDETTGDTYYYDPITDVKTWEEPPELMAYKQQQKVEKERLERLENMGKNRSSQAINSDSPDEKGGNGEENHADLVDCLLVSNNILEAFGNLERFERV